LGFFSFGKKQPSTQPSQQPGATPDGAPAGAAPGSPSGAFVAQPEKARKFFEHARTIAQTGNSEYALMLYAKGLRLDPVGDAKFQATPPEGGRHEDAWRIAVSHFKSGGKPATKEQIKELDGPGPIDKFVQAEYIWWRDPKNLDALFRMLETAGKAGQIDYGSWVARTALEIVKAHPKQSKSLWLKAKTYFMGVEAWSEALLCVEQAVHVDPTDTQLAADLKELTARQALKRGGYDKASGQTGGLKSNLKDAEKQQERQDAQAITVTEETEAKNIERARADLEANPMSGDAVQKLGTLLRRRGTAEAEEEAHTVLMGGFERLREYRFKMLAGEIRVGQARRLRDAALKAFQADPENAGLKEEYQRVRLELLDLESRELREKQRNFPTDRSIKFELGRIEFELGNFDDAMAAFQSCKDEAKLRIVSTHMLGRCFAASGWHGEAIGEFREALQGLGAGEGERELPIKYDLMVSLMEQARTEKSGAAAREAGEICSAIVRRDISYRDIRTKRKEIDALMKELPT
jgi:tetratricopeptide (TPR) repeat protein